MMTTNPWMYVVLLGLVLIVYARLLPKSEVSASKNNVVQEIEETIEHFAVEMDEQNRAILDLFSKTRQDYEVEMAKLSGRLELLEKQKSELAVELSKIHVTSQMEFTGQAASKTIQEMESKEEASVVNAAPLGSQFQLREGGNDEAQLIVEDAKELPYTGLSMKSRYPELFSLYDQGKGVEIIAKKLGMNKGEVNLIIQLSRQEERSRA